MLLASLLDLLDSCAPLQHAEPWDNVGLLLGEPTRGVTSALVAIDVTHAVIDEAQALGADLIIAYHPTWFAAQKRLVGDALLLRLARANLCLYSPHTALDAAQKGTNDVLADAAGVAATGRVPLQPCADAPEAGMGRVGPLTQPQPFGPWLRALKQALGLQHALVACPPGEPSAAVARVAVCAGAGDAVWQRALELGADTFVTGELRHHHALAAVAQKMRVISVLHSNSERPALPLYARRMQQLAPDVTFRVSASDADPYSFS